MGEHAWKLEKASTEARIETCPICSKKFIPAPEHYWKIGTGEYDMDTRIKNVCSYSCMRKWERQQEAKRKERRERARLAREKRTYKNNQ